MLLPIRLAFVAVFAFGCGTIQLIGFGPGLMFALGVAMLVRF